MIPTLQHIRLRQRLTMALSLLICLGASGCVVKDIGRTVEQTVKGDYYLRAEKFEQGRQSFRREVEENPQSALARYYYGRFLLQDDDVKEALTQLVQARDLEAGNADYHFWAGVAYGESGDGKREEQSYRTALRLDSRHLQAMIYLGHSLLEQKRYRESLEMYAKALEIWPDSPSSLYNRALILNRLGRTPEEKRAWHEYLLRYPSGAMARRASAHLNRLGDYTYRNHVLGVRTITTEKIWFEPFSASLSGSSRESLKMIGSVYSTMMRGDGGRGGTLQVVAFQKNNKELAHRKAIEIKRFLLREFPDVPGKRIGISWFAEPQVITVGKRKRTIDESVSFFITAR